MSMQQMIFVKKGPFDFFDDKEMSIYGNQCRMKKNGDDKFWLTIFFVTTLFFSNPRLPYLDNSKKGKSFFRNKRSHIVFDIKKRINMTTIRFHIINHPILVIWQIHYTARNGHSLAKTIHANHCLNLRM